METDLNKVSVFLIYRGNLVFEDSRQMTNPEAKEQRQYFQKLEKYYDHKHACDALERLKERDKKLKEKSKPQKPVIESDIEELSEVSGDIMPEVGDETEGEEEAEEPEKKQTKSSFYCSECERARRFANALNCAKCSKCQKEKQNQSSSEDLDLEKVLDETVEQNIMHSDKTENNESEHDKDVTDDNNNEDT